MEEIESDREREEMRERGRSMARDVEVGEQGCGGWRREILSMKD